MKTYRFLIQIIPIYTLGIIANNFSLFSFTLLWLVHSKRINFVYKFYELVIIVLIIVRFSGFLHFLSRQTVKVAYNDKISFSLPSKSYLFHCFIILDRSSNIMPKQLVTADNHDLLMFLMIKCLVFCHLASGGGYLIEMDTLYHLKGISFYL